MKEEYTKRYIDLADQYLEGVIASDDLDLLKKEMNKEPFLKKVIEQHVQAKANIRVAGEQQLKSALMDRFEEIPEKEKSSKLWIKVIAALLLLAIMFFAYTMVQNSRTEYFIAEIEAPSFDVMRSDGLVLDEQHWTKAIALFNQEDYRLCLAEITKIKDDLFIENNFGKIQIMKGYCGIKLNQNELAYESFEKIKGDNPYYDQSLWYLSVYSYQLNDLEKAKGHLNDILKNQNHFKYKEAKLLLDEIKN